MKSFFFSYPPIARGNVFAQISHLFLTHPNKETLDTYFVWFIFADSKTTPLIVLNSINCKLFSNLYRCIGSKISCTGLSDQASQWIVSFGEKDVFVCFIMEKFAIVRNRAKFQVLKRGKLSWLFRKFPFFWYLRTYQTSNIWNLFAVYHME